MTTTHRAATTAVSSSSLSLSFLLLSFLLSLLLLLPKGTFCFTLSQNPAFLRFLHSESPNKPPFEYPSHLNNRLYSDNNRLSLTHTPIKAKANSDALSMSALTLTGFIGLGIMGKGMVRNLLTKFPEKSFVVWNRSPEPAEELVSQFPGRVSVAATAADVIAQSQVTFSMLSTQQASEQVFDDASTGALLAVSEGKIIVDCATLSPERMQQISKCVQDRGGLFMEAPVSGSKVPAETGQLIFLCGGSEHVFTTVEKELAAMGKASFYFGDIGQGSRVKLVVNMVMGSMMSSFAEGLTLASATDIPADKLLQVLDLGVMANPMFRGKGPNMAAGNFGTHFPLKHAQKDMRLALELGASRGVSLPTAAAANGCYEQCIAEGRGDQDFSAVINATKPK